MPTVEAEVQKNNKNTQQQVVTTTLNVVFNGTMVMGFGPDDITVIAPYIAQHPGHPEHLYEINHVDFKKNKNVKFNLPRDPGSPDHWDRIIDRSQVLMLDKSTIGGMPSPGVDDAVIRLPYPDFIHPLRLLDMTFDNPSSNGRYAGALVFSYTDIPDGSITVAGISCKVRNAVSNFSELHVLASIKPRTPDPGDTHSIRSWKAVANLIHSKLQWQSGDDSRPQPKRVPGMDCDVDEPDYPIVTNAKWIIKGGGNCKVPIAIVTHQP